MGDFDTTDLECDLRKSHCGESAYEQCFRCKDLVREEHAIPISGFEHFYASMTCLQKRRKLCSTTVFKEAA
jgi:hypothetical protein